MARMLIAAVSALALLSVGAPNNSSAQTASPSETTALPRPDFHFKGQVGRTFQAVSYTHLTLPTICSV